MAAGDGFKQVPFGFDKNEVNSYISDLRKKMSANEAEMRKNEEKTKAAEKLAAEADERIKAAVDEGNRKAEELTAQLDEEKETTKRQLIEIRNLKDRIDSEKKKMTDMLKNGKGVSEEATRAFNEVIEKANEEAAAIIENAGKQADELISDARRRSALMAERTDGFLKMLREQLESMNSGYNAMNAAAAELLGTQPAAAAVLPEAPAFSPAPAAVPEEDTPAVIPEAATPAAEPAEEAPAAEPEPVNEPQPEVEPEPPVSEPEPITEPDESDIQTFPLTEEDGAPAVFDGEWAGSDMAQAVAEAEKSMRSEDKDIPLMNPDSGSDPFGGLFSMEDEQTDMTDIDLDKPVEQEDSVEDVKPLDVSEHSDAAFNNDFTKDLLSQTISSNSLDAADADSDILEAVKAAEKAFAVQPTDVSDIDMDEGADQPQSDESEEDALMRALREAEEALNSVKQSADSDVGEPEEAPAAEDPWADLQKQLEAMESANGAGSAITYDEPEPQQEEQAAPPTTDDSSIWDFGSASGSGSSEDDDMSSDFGGFGGF